MPVKGANRSIICDTQYNTFIFITNDVFDLLKSGIVSLKDCTKSQYEITQYLVECNMGQYVENPENFPIIDFYSSDYPSKISNAVIDFNASSKHLYKLQSISDQLSALQCTALELRFYSHISYEILVNSIQSFNNSTVRSIYVSINYSSWMNDSLILKTLNLIDKLYRVTIFGDEENIIRKYTSVKMLIKTTEVLIDEEHCGYVSPYYFNSSLQFIKESLTANNCLNKKIAIDKDGFIKNCPAMAVNYGNIENTLLSEVVNKDCFKSIGIITKDKVTVCKDCEYRYICHDCRVFIDEPSNIYSKPSKCKYNPYEATWA